jgi:hypothetical protein
MRVIGPTGSGSVIVEMHAKQVRELKDVAQRLGAMAAEMPDIECGADGLVTVSLPERVVPAAVTAGVAEVFKKKHAGGRPKKVAAPETGRKCEICGKPVKSARARCCSKACIKEKARRAYREKYSHRARAAAFAAQSKLAVPDRAKAEAKAARLAAIKHAADLLDPVAAMERKAAVLREEEA